VSLARLQVSPKVRAGEAVEVRLLIQHPMETGFRREADGRAVPMNVVNSLVCRLGGVEVLRAEFGSGVSANPYLSFWIVPPSGGDLVVEWVDDAGVKGRVAAPIALT
jgi:sulfur-oxidizing protein SoxZ